MIIGTKIQVSNLEHEGVVDLTASQPPVLHLVLISTKRYPIHFASQTVCALL